MQHLLQAILLLCIAHYSNRSRFKGFLGCGVVLVQKEMGSIVHHILSQGVFEVSDARGLVGILEQLFIIVVI